MGKTILTHKFPDKIDTNGVLCLFFCKVELLGKFKNAYGRVQSDGTKTFVQFAKAKNAYRAVFYEQNTFLLSDLLSILIF
jgi:hypothetical protein